MAKTPIVPDVNVYVSGLLWIGVPHQKGNTVILDQEPEVQEGTEAIVMVQTTEEDEQEIVQRQKAILERGFAMGKLRYKKREELYEREK